MSKRLSLRIERRLRAQAAAHGLTADVGMAAAEVRNGWLRLPVYLQGISDAYDNARLLQELEDEWNAQEVSSYPKLLLLPMSEPCLRVITMPEQEMSQELEQPAPREKMAA